MFTKMKLRHLLFAPVLSLLLANTHVQADEGLAAFNHIAEPAPRARPDQWGPVPTYLFSIVNVAPGLLPFFNNATVFGVPGTVVGNFWQNTQLTGDWGGARTELARRGFFFDASATSAYQNVTAGGLKTGGSFVQNNKFHSISIPGVLVGGPAV